MTQSHTKLPSSESPEHSFYARKRFDPPPGATWNPSEASAAGEYLFRPGGRYHIVEKHLGSGPRPINILEIGCNNGESVAYMRRFSDQVIGADIILPPLLRRWPNQGGTSFVEFNANHRFPLESGSCGAIVAMMVLEHLFDPFHFCAEAARVLAPGGWLFLNIPLVTGIRNRLRLITGRAPITSQLNADWFAIREWDGGHLHYFTVDLCKRLVADANFAVVDMRGVGRLSRLKSLLPSLLPNELSLACQLRPAKG